jgi:hypothetical protein
LQLPRGTHTTHADRAAHPPARNRAPTSSMKTRGRSLGSSLVDGSPRRSLMQ